MRVDVSCKYMDKSTVVTDIIDKGLKKIERRVLIFKKDAPIHVSIHLEKNPRKEEYFCRTHVYLPAKVLVAQEKSDNVDRAINKTIAAISRQLGKVKDKVEHLRRPRGDKAKAQVEGEFDGGDE